jgi:uncharacterized protein
VQKLFHALIELQEVDNRLDELMDDRGDLPTIVTDLEEKLAKAKNKLESYEQEIKSSKLRIKEVELLLNEAQEKLDKYNNQLYQVKTNKEYDAITTEIETVQESQKQYDNEVKSISSQIDEKMAAISDLEGQVASIEKDLAENRVELDASLEETAEEEQDLNNNRAKIIKNISQNVLKTYEKVRNAREGKGIAILKNGNCGGCFSYIPPQKIVEVRKMKKIFECEACGRILIWNDK